MAGECSYGDSCEQFPVALVPCKFCDGGPLLLHHVCQAKYENYYGIEGKEMSYICRPCMDKEHYDVIENVKNVIDSETESDTIVDIYG